LHRHHVIGASLNAFFPRYPTEIVLFRLLCRYPTMY